MLAKRITFVVMLVAVAFAIFRGVGLGDIEEVLNNASILCLSCVGIG